MNLKEGEIIAEHYQLKQQLGTGSFGDVWLAHNLLADIDVAIKFYGTLDESGLQTFRNEFKVAYKLRHPNLLNISHFDVFRNSPYLVMPYCENGSLRQFVGRMSEREIWKLVSDVTGGLAFLHSQQPPIVHQDIKPDNILITSDGRYVISDFGISRSLRTELSRTNNAASSSGTLAYMGPERFSEKPLTVLASDVWALGMTLYEVITGDVLWEGMGGCVQLNGARIPRMDNVSPKLSKIIMACLSAEPWNRPTAHQIHQYASAYLQHQQLPTLNDQYEVRQQEAEPSYQDSANRRNDFRQETTSIKPTTSKVALFNRRKAMVAAALVAAIILLAGGVLFVRSSLGEERDFGNCKSKEDFELFIKNYPDSRHTAVARMRIAAMTTHAEVAPQQESTHEEKAAEAGPPAQSAEKRQPEPAEETLVIVEKPRHAQKKGTDENGVEQTTQQTADSDTEADDDNTFRACSSVYAYEDYLMRFPNGKHRAEAERAIKNLQSPTNIDIAAEPAQQHGRGRPQHLSATQPPSSYSISIRPAGKPGRQERPHSNHNHRRAGNWRK